MKFFIDSSVLVAAFDMSHPHYAPSHRLLASSNAASAGAAAHSLAETYASITRLPLSPKPMPEHALRFIESVRPKIHWVALDEAEYGDVIRDCARRYVQGAKLYDALILAAAQKFGAERIFTWNRKDFEVLAEGLNITVSSP